jgi:glycosyltransferase involved in cell wall biosynthesis
MTNFKNILYIGNNLVKKNNNTTTMGTLSILLEINGINVYKSSNKSNKVLRLIDMCFSILKYKNKIDCILIDTYSTFNFYFAFTTSQLARFLKIKYIPILHGGNLPTRLDKSLKMSKAIFNNSYANIAPSGYLQHEFFKKNYNSILIPNSISISEYQLKKREKLEPKLLYVRAFSKIYNPLMAIKVLHELKKNYPNATLCMIGPDSGDGSLYEVKELVTKLKLNNSVEFTGSMAKSEWHKKSKDFDIFINTTNIDNTPISVIEGMALGLPIVSTNVGGIPYLIKNNLEGVLVDADNEMAMCSAISELIETPKIVKELTKNARKKAESFDEAVVIDNWIDILK